MICQIADQVGLEQKIAAIRFLAPNNEPDYVYLVYTGFDGEETTMELDSAAIIALAEQLKKRAEK